MARAAIEGFLLFLAPFAVFAVWVVALRGGPGARDAFRGAFAWLTICGLALALAGILWTAFLSPHDIGPYEPAHTENGVLVPGKVK